MNVEGLSLDHMRAALAVATAGSFSAAARILHRKQSAVSYAVAKLERQLGIALFDRSDGLRPIPTPVGMALLRQIEAVVRSAEDIRNRARAAAKGLETEIFLTIDSFYPASELTALLDGFAEKFPTVPLRIEIESMGGVQKSVAEGKCIFGIAGSLPNLPAGMIGDAVTRISRIPVVAARHPLAAGNAECIQLPAGLLLDFVQIVVTDRSGTTAGRDFAVYTGRTWRVSELSLKRDLILAGLGWGYMPEHLISDDLASGRLCILQVEGLRQRNNVSLMAIRLRDSLLGPAAEWIWSRLVPDRPIQRKSNVGVVAPTRRKSCIVRPGPTRP